MSGSQVWIPSTFVDIHFHYNLRTWESIHLWQCWRNLSESSICAFSLCIYLSDQGKGKMERSWGQRNSALVLSLCIGLICFNFFVGGLYWLPVRAVCSYICHVRLSILLATENFVREQTRISC